jgi:hypothetical protein
MPHVYFHPNIAFQPQRDAWEAACLPHASARHQFLMPEEIGALAVLLRRGENNYRNSAFDRPR